MSAAQDSRARRQTTGIIVSLASVMIVGWASIFGKMAYRERLAVRERESRRANETNVTLAMV